jgi:hypothetical protein
MSSRDQEIRAKIATLVGRSECLAPSVAGYADTISGKKLENLLITVHDIVHRESRLEPQERERFRRVATGLNQELARSIREAALVRMNAAEGRARADADASSLLSNFQ